VARAGLPCKAVVDGMAVRVDEGTLYQPDVILRCGARMAWDTVAVPDPLLLVEVVSPSTAVLDTDGKLAGSFRVPSVRHTLILHAEARTLIHHARESSDGPIATRVLRAGTVAPDPPGIVLDVPALFGGPEPPPA
jgi:Uma2 family endonuclease